MSKASCAWRRADPVAIVATGPSLSAFGIANAVERGKLDKEALSLETLWRDPATPTRSSATSSG